MSDELIPTTFTDEFSTDFPQQQQQQFQIERTSLANSSLSRQTVVTLMQPSLIQQTPIITTPTTLFNNHEAVIGTVPSNHQQQQQQQLTFPGTGQMMLTAGGGSQQAQQYVVQNVVTPVSFVQTSSNVSGLIPMMAASNMQTLPQSQHAQLVPAQGCPPRTVIITQRPIQSGSSVGAPTLINTVQPKVVTLQPGIGRPILENKVTVVTSTGNISNAISSQPIFIQTSSTQQQQQQQPFQTIITASKVVGGRGRGRGSSGRGRGRTTNTTEDVKKKKDPNAPLVPLSAYKFFFKETGQTVKNHNPAAKFGDVSRIVASMWERLSDDEKAIYRKLSEDDKARYKREMQDYKSNEDLDDNVNDDDDEENEPSTTSNSSVFSMTASTPSVVISNGKPKVNPEDVTNTICIRKGCASLAIRNAEWEDEYCSNECVVAHCKDVFADWVTGNLTT